MVEEPRLKARFRVQALLRQGAAVGSSGAVVRRGDDESGSLLVLLRTPDNQMAVLAEARLPDGSAGFVRGAGGAALVAAGEASAYVERAVARDPDLWVVELDVGMDGAPPFPARIL